MGGDIIVKSEENKGSCFEIYIVSKNSNENFKSEIIKLEFDQKKRNKLKSNHKLIVVKEENLLKVPADESHPNYTESSRSHYLFGDDQDQDSSLSNNNSFTQIVQKTESIDEFKTQISARLFLDSS